MQEKSPENIQYLIPLLVISLLAILIRIYCFRGFIGLDDAEYAKIAYKIAEGSFAVGDYSGPPVFPLRVGLTFPTAILFHFFGVNEWTLVTYPLILSLSGIFLAYFCAASLFNKRAGLIAALFWSVLPIDLVNSTKLLPDGLAAFYASLATVWLIILVRSELKQKWHLLLYGFLIGLLFGFSWLCKESVVYYVPFCMCVFLLTIKNNWPGDLYLWVGIAIGSAGILLSEMGIYYHLTGDWMFRFHEIERNYHMIPDSFFTEGSRWGWPVGGDYSKAVVKRLFVTGPKMIFFNSQFLYLPLLGLLASLVALCRKDKSFLYPVVWLLTLFLMFNFASSSSSSYAPLALLNRYLYPVCFPAIILGAAFLDKLYCTAKSNNYAIIKRVFGGLLITFFILVCTYHLYLEVKYGHRVRESWSSDIRKISRDLPSSSTIYTDAISKKGLEFFWRYPDHANINNFEGMTSTRMIHTGSYVLIQNKYLRWLNINAGMWLSDGRIYRQPPFVTDPPPGWNIVFQGKDTSLFLAD